MISQKIATKEIELGELISISKGKKLLGINQGCSPIHKRYIQINDLRPGANPKYTNSETGVEVIPEDLIIAWDGANAGTIGYGLEGFIGSTLARLRPEVQDLYTPFVGRFLQSRFQLIRDNCAGATIPHVSRSFLESIEIPLPPLSEQKRIAAILDKADAIRKKRKQAIELTETFLRSTFLEMFGDPVTNPKGWEKGTIETVVTNSKEDIRCGPFGTQLKVHELVPSGVPLWGIENVHNDLFEPDTKKFLTREKAEQLNRFDAEEGDVLVTRMGTIGRACVVPKGAGQGRISYHLFRIRPDRKKCLPEFLTATISRSGTFHAQLKRLAHGAIMDGLSTGMLKEVQFLLPPIPSQKKYIDLVNIVEGKIQHHKAGTEQLEALFISLTQRAFRGEL